MKRYIKTAIIKKKIRSPVFLILFVTDRCNSRCRHCFNWKTLKPAKNEIKLEEIENLAKQLPLLESVSLSGGEPFLRKDIVEIYEIFNKYCKRLSSFTIPTNGLLPELQKKKIEEILSISGGKGGISLNLSLDGLEKTHDYIRGVKGGFKKLLKTYDLVKGLLKKYKNFTLRANTTITNYNVDEIPKLIEFVKKNMHEAVSHNFEFMRGKPKDPKLRCPSLSKLKRLKKTIYKTFEYYNFFPKSKLKSKLVNGLKKYQYDLYLKILEKHKQVIPCYAGITHAVVDAQANVYFCEMLPKVGSLRKTRKFSDVWYSEKAVKQRKFIRNKGCYCTHSCFQNGNILYNPFVYPSVLKKIVLE